MANKIKTSPTKKQDTKTTTSTMQAVVSALQSLQKSVDTLNATQVKANVSAKEADSKSKEMLKMMEGYEAKRKELEEKRKEDKWQNNLNLAKGMTDAVMPADRRADFGQIGLAALTGIDPAVIKMLGIDKLGANLWNSKLGWNAISQRHQDKRTEQKLNEEFGLKNNRNTEKYGSVIEKETTTIQLLRQIAKNTSNDKKTDEVVKENEEKGGLLSKILGFAKKLIFPLLAGLMLSAFKPIIKNMIGNLFGKEGMWGDIGQFIGGTIADILPGAIGGLLLGSKLGMPLKGALIGSAISYVLPRLLQATRDISDIFSNKQIKDAGSTNRYLEKGISGALIGASIGKSLKSATIGALIGLSSEFILARINDIKSLFTGESSDSTLTEGILGGVISGATIGAFGAKGKSKTISLRGMFVGGLIGGVSGMIISLIGNGKEILSNIVSGESQSDAILGGVISGATIGAFGSGKGHRMGFSLRGMIIGGIIGGTVGLITAMVADTMNIARMAKKGEENPESAFGSYGKIISTLIAGAAIGSRYGIKGAFIGALVGGAIGGILTLIDQVNKDVAEKRKSGRDEINSFTKVESSENATSATSYAINKKRELEEKRAKGIKLTDKEENELNTLEEGLYRAEKRLGDAKKADRNGDGRIDANEYEWYKKHVSSWGFGGEAKTQTQMKELMNRSNGKGFTLQELSDYQLTKYDSSIQVPIKSTPMPTQTDIQQTKSTEKLTDSNEKLMEAINKLNKTIDDKDLDTKIINNEILKNNKSKGIFGVGVKKGE